MAKNGASMRAELSDWETESLRVTAFPSASETIGRPAWWAKVVGQEADIQAFRSRQGLSEEKGTWGPGTLSLAVQPFRIDWVLSPRDTELAELPPSVGRFDQLRSEWAKLMACWFGQDDCPKLVRLALGAVLLLPVPGLTQGYEKLAAYLPNVRLDPGTSSDFLYQVNRARNSRSGIAGLRINRLARWSVATYIRGALSAAGPKISLAPGPPVFACRLELDVNTHQEFVGELKAPQLDPVFLELLDLSAEIAEKGDIP